MIRTTNNTNRRVILYRILKWRFLKKDFIEAAKNMEVYEGEGCL
jgi:hypothetical protein